MKVQVEKKPESVSTLRIELPPDEVSKEWDTIANSFARFAKIPGYRPGKAPRAVIDKRFRKEIQDEVTKKLVSKSYREAIEHKKFWVHLAADNFLPKFCEQIVGQKREETRTVVVDLPADFLVKELAGKQASYTVTLHEIKEKVLPAVDDAFANKLLPGKSLAELRHTIDHDLEHEKEHEVERAKETQIVKYLHEKIQFDLPPSLLRNETKRALTELVQRNRARGIPDEMLKDKEKELIETAASVAHHRLKTNFILERIAEQEKIEVRREDVDLRIRQEAQHYNISSDKMRKELEEHDGLNALAEQILLGKTLDFLKANVSVQPVSEEQTAKK